MLFSDLLWSQQVGASSKTKGNRSRAYKYTYMHSPSLRASREGSKFTELHSPPAKEHETVISTVETVLGILFCSNMTGRSTMVESLQNFLMNFWLAITDKSSCWLHRMINILFEMMLESEIGNSRQAQGVAHPRVFLILLLQAGKPSIHATSLLPTAQGSAQPSAPS